MSRVPPAARKFTRPADAHAWAAACRATSAQIRRARDRYTVLMGDSLVEVTLVG